jgi:glycerol uptake facilitator-like aquaporin
VTGGTPTPWDLPGMERGPVRTAQDRRDRRRSDPGLSFKQLAADPALVAIILAVGSVSGVNLNPVISLIDRVIGGLSTCETGR